MSIVFAANYNNLWHIIVPFCIYRELSVAEKNLRSIHNCRQKYITEPKKASIQPMRGHRHMCSVTQAAHKTKSSRTGGEPVRLRRICGIYAHGGELHICGVDCVNLQP